MGTQPKQAATPRLIFGAFEFDDATGELLKHGTRLRLQGQPLDILAMLVRRRGDLITRDEFQRQLWHGGTFVDFDHGLNAAINRLRQVLGDSANQPRYIETIPGRGYRFIAPVEVASPRSVAVVPASVPAQRSRWRVSAAWAGIAAAVGVAYLVGTQQRELPVFPPVRFAVSAPEGFVLEPGAGRQSMALSPDGAHLAFTALDASGLYTLFVHDLRSGESRMIPATRGAHSVIWGPDNRSLYYSLRGSLYRTDLGGSAAQMLGSVPPFLSAGTTLPSGNILLAGAEACIELPRNGGAPARIKVNCRWPQLLPGGSRILYADLDASTGRHRIRTVELGKPDTMRQVLESDSRAQYAPSAGDPSRGYLLTVRAGNLLAHPFDLASLSLAGPPVGVAAGVYSFPVNGAADFSVSENGVLAYRAYAGHSQLAWVDGNGEVLQPVGPKGVSLKSARLSPDGVKIATSIFDVSRGVADIWIVDARTGESRVLARGPGMSTSPEWSPDSKSLVYGRAFGSGPKLYIRGVAQDAAEEALPKDFFQLPGSWSPDGKYIAYSNSGYAQTENEMQGDILVVDLEHRGKPLPLVKTQFHEASPAFSPDGRWLAFMSNESGRAEVYLQAFQSAPVPRVAGERYLVSSTGAACLRWRRDGKEIYFVGADGVLYASTVRLATRPVIGKPRALFTISLEARGAVHAQLGFDVSPDGSRFLVPVVDSGAKSEIVVVQNWESMVTRQ